MQFNNRYGGSSDKSFLISLSAGGVGEGNGDKLTSDTISNTKLQAFCQAVGSGTCHPGMTLHNSRESCSFSFFDFSKDSKGKRCVRDHETAGDALPEDDLSLVLGLGSTPDSLNGGASSESGTSYSLEGEGKESTCDYLTSSRGIVSSVISIPRTSLNSGSEGYSDDSQEPGVDNSALFRLESQQSSSWIPGYRDDARKVSNGLISNSGENTCGMDLQLGLSTHSSSIMLDCLSGMPSNGYVGCTQESMSDVLATEHTALIDEGSTSARWIKSGGYITALSCCVEATINQSGSSSLTILSPEDRTELDLFMSREALITSGPACESVPGFSGHALKNIPAVSSVGSLPSTSERTSRMCNFKGCAKGARGASGLCIAHGGGLRCHRLHCNKGAEGRTMYCKAHGGGRRCENLGCIRSAEGRTNFCIGHGGGCRCNHEGCNKAARGKSGLCIRHGGGKRCQKEGCTKSAEGFSGLCISHGGGRRCQFTGCGKGSQGSTMFCKAHGGGRRCVFEGCTKGAEGSTPFCKGHGGGKRCMFGGGTCTKSVHGATFFCVAHGGGKRCASEGCSKSARGSTDYCVRHGGGKRCKFKDCSKSAQGSTDFCKAHGGGKKCSWCQEGSTYSGNIMVDRSENNLRGPCNRFARGKSGFCAAHSALVQQLKGTSCSSNSNSTIPDLVPEPVPKFIPNDGCIQPPSDVSKHSCQFGSMIDYDQQPFFDISEAQQLQYASASSLRSGINTVFAHVGRPWCGFPLPQRSLQSKSPSAVNMNNSKAAESTFFVGVPHSHDISGKSVGPPEKLSSFFLTELMFPLSTQKGDLPLPDKMHCGDLADPNSALADDISSMFSLSVPEERVHGGGLMAMLAKEASKHVEIQ